MPQHLPHFRLLFQAFLSEALTWRQNGILVLRSKQLVPNILDRIPSPLNGRGAYATPQAAHRTETWLRNIKMFVDAFGLPKRVEPQWRYVHEQHLDNPTHRDDVAPPTTHCFAASTAQRRCCTAHHTWTCCIPRTETRLHNPPHVEVLHSPHRGEVAPNTTHRCVASMEQRRGCTAHHT